MSDTTYNGWTNYPTWTVHLWLTNEEGSYNECLRTAGDAIRHSNTPRVYLADALREQHQEAAYDLAEGIPTSVFTDLLGWAIGHVDWFEIADSFLEDESLDATREIAARRR